MGSKTLYSADEALAIGLVRAIVEPDQLANEADTLARRIVSYAPLTISVTKEGLEWGLRWEGH